MDSDASGECYGASVPLSYILDGNFEPILAYEMNAKVLPLDHGFPIRVILPGKPMYLLTEKWGVEMS